MAGNTKEDLSQKERALVPIAAFTANGDTEKLRSALEAGLADGLSINEIKEVIIQLYAYTGFPRSLTAMDTFRKLLEERKGRGIADPLGPEPESLPKDADRLAIGTKIQTDLVGRTVSGPLYDFAPEMNTLLREHLFCDIFSRKILSNQERELVTISALAALPAPAQLASHLRVCLHTGLTMQQLREAAGLLGRHVSPKTGELVSGILDKMESSAKK